jgi:acetyl esterase/lipase
MWFRLVALTLFAPPLLAQTPAPQFTAVSDVQYCTGGGKPLLMDVFLPENRIRTPTPAMLWIHGGGWERGDKNGNSGAQLLANEGFVTASLFYRLSGDSPFQPTSRIASAPSVFYGRTQRNTASPPTESV